MPEDVATCRTCGREPEWFAIIARAFREVALRCRRCNAYAWASHERDAVKKWNEKNAGEGGKS